MANPFDGVLTFESMHVDVSWPTIDSTVSYPADADIIVIVGFFNSTDPVGALIPVASLEGGIASCQGLDEFNRPTSDTAKALLSAWEAGGRHVALYRAGDPADVANLSDEARLAIYYDALESAYLELRDLSFVAYIVPADVCFEDVVPAEGVSTLNAYAGAGGFAFQLAMHCAGFKTEYIDNIVQGVMSCSNSDPVITMLGQAMTNKINYQKTNCTGQGNAVGESTIWFPEADPFRFLTVASSRALIYSTRTTASYEYGLGAAYAGRESSLQDTIGATGRRIDNINLKHVVSRSEADSLSRYGLVPFGMTVDSRRGRAADVVILSDNNLAIPVSDFQQNQTLRFVRRVTNQLVRLAEPFIGTPGVGIEKAMTDHLASLERRSLIKSYQIKYARNPNDATKLNVLVELNTYFSTKVITIATAVGPIYQ